MDRAAVRKALTFALAIIIAFVALDFADAVLAFTTATVAYYLFNKFRPNKAFGVTTTFALNAYASYVGVPWLAYATFAYSLLLWPEWSPLTLPGAVMAITGAVAVSPLFGGYPTSVKVGNNDPYAVFSSALPLTGGGLASALGFLLPYVSALAFDKLAPLTPIPPMIKLSEPLFIGIEVGILVNVVRVKVRLASGIKKARRH